MKTNLENPRILVVDDSSTYSKHIHNILKKISNQVYFLTSGELVMDFLHENTVDLLLLDLIMPEVSGLEVLEQCRKTFSMNRLPVIVLTGKEDDSDDVVNALKLGANDFINKSNSNEVILSRIVNQLNLHILHRESVKAKELETISTMIATYNHEINNPLMVAMGNLSKGLDKITEKNLMKAMESLEKIRDIVAKIKQLTEIENIEKKDYLSNSKVFGLSSQSKDDKDSND